MDLETAKIIESRSGVDPARPRQILNEILSKDANKTIDIRDITNKRDRDRRKMRGGYTDTQLLIKVLTEKGEKFTVRYHNDDPTDQLIGLFWIPSGCIKNWRRFYWILQMDNTYQTNRFKMPLFTFGALSNVQTVVHIGFGLVDNETADGFTWLISQMEKFRVELDIPRPNAFITDKELALRNALRALVPDARQLLCIFHLNQNVAKNFKKKWRRRPDAPVNAKDQEADNFLLTQSDQALAADLNKPPEAEPDRANIAKIGYSLAGLWKLYKFMLYTQLRETYDLAKLRMRVVFHDQVDILGMYSIGSVCHVFY